MLPRFPAKAKRTISPLIYHFLLTGVLLDESLFFSFFLFSSPNEQKLPAVLSSKSLFMYLLATGLEGHSTDLCKRRVKQSRPCQTQKLNLLSVVFVNFGLFLFHSSSC